MSPPVVTCVGEAIVDFIATDSGVHLKDARRFLKAAGGAPANVAVGLARLGTRSAFVGTVGDDPFGRFLTAFLRSEGVDVRGVRSDPERRTRLAFVSLTDSGARDFAFWETRPADELLRLTEPDIRRISRSKIVHLSSFMLLNTSTREAVMRFAGRLRKSRTQISFDPNLRLALWDSRARARLHLRNMMSRSDIVKMNEEEAAFVTGKRSRDAAAAAILRQGPGLVVLTAGEKGCSFFTRSASGNVPAFVVQAVDTTGCGDAFLAALLHRLCRLDSAAADVPAETLNDICRYANAVGALSAKEYGAMTVPPPLVVEEYLRER